MYSKALDFKLRQLSSFVGSIPAFAELYMSAQDIVDNARIPFAEKQEALKRIDAHACSAMNCIISEIRKTL